MQAMGWRARAVLMAQRLWQPTSACMTCMSVDAVSAWDLAHWKLALTTGGFTGLLAVALTFTPAAWLFRERHRNAALMGGLTVIGDFFAHAGAGPVNLPETLGTGLVSALLTLAGSYLFEDRARRLRALWASARRP